MPLLKFVLLLLGVSALIVLWVVARQRMNRVFLIAGLAILAGAAWRAWDYSDDAAYSGRLWAPAIGLGALAALWAVGWVVTRLRQRPAGGREHDRD